MKISRQIFCTDFKFKVALEIIKEVRRVSMFEGKYSVR